MWLYKQQHKQGVAESLTDQQIAGPVNTIEKKGDRERRLQVRIPLRILCQNIKVSEGALSEIRDRTKHKPWAKSGITVKVQFYITKDSHKSMMMTRNIWCVEGTETIDVTLILRRNLHTE